MVNSQSHFSEAKAELGEAIAAKLKLSSDGTKVLWPQPTDSPLDPQNWSPRRKNIQLLIMTLASIVPDFVSGIGRLTQQTCTKLLCWLEPISSAIAGIAGIFALARQYDTTPGVINNLTSKLVPQITFPSEQPPTESYEVGVYSY